MEELSTGVENCCIDGEDEEDDPLGKRVLAESAESPVDVDVDVAAAAAAAIIAAVVDTGEGVMSRICWEPSGDWAAARWEPVGTETGMEEADGVFAGMT